MHPFHRRVTLARALAGVALVSLVAACGDSATEPHTGSLVVPAIAGLPAGTTGNVVVTGPGGFERVLDGAAPDTLDALAPGAYTIRASELLLDGTRWSPAPDTQTVGVYDGFRFSARQIVYAVSSARLAVNVLGIPDASTIDYEVTGPGGYRRTFPYSTTLGPLDPGTYTIVAHDVQAGGRTYRPAPATQTVTLAAGELRTAAIEYGAGDATLALTITGLPDDAVHAGVIVMGPNGYARRFIASHTLEHLEAGTWRVIVENGAESLASYASTAGEQTIQLASGASAAASVSFVATPLALGLDLFVEGLSNPAFATAPAGDARLFVVERAGRVRLVKDGALLATPFLDIRTRVNSVGERGMLGLAFDPEYAQNGRFYVYYVDLSGGVTVERFTSTPGSDVAGASAGIVIAIPHGGSEHHGGTIAFGPDRMLYMAPGDGGCCGDPRDNAQNGQVLLGKVLRLDVRSASTYTIPADNPFVGVAGVRPEIWATGLRNPWRFSFDASERMLYIGDVGQDAREEVDVVPATAVRRNFGWPVTEGTACYRPSSGCDRTGQTMPVEEYTHADGCSVTGGFVYRGTSIPELAGHYLYADYCRGWVRSFRLTSAGTAGEQRAWSGITVPGALSFGIDGMGELYVVTGSGRIWKLVRR